MSDGPQTFTVTTVEAGQTLAAVIRRWAAMPGATLSWAQARQVVAARRVRINATVCTEDARRLSIGERVEVSSNGFRPPPAVSGVVVRHQDEHLVVVEKPAGLLTVRNPEEFGWDEKRKGRQPTFDELLQKQLPRPRPRPGQATDWRVRPVHRLDRDTSGLMLFALSAMAEQRLIAMFAKHVIHRSYWAVVHGRLPAPTTYESYLVRDRGDGRRGTLPAGRTDPDAQLAVTHVRPVEPIGDRYTVVECRLETGRTHQIRIHLSEAGHPLCGDRVYRGGQPRSPNIPDFSNAPRQALHSQHLEFEHPVDNRPMTFDSAWPVDLAKWLATLRSA